jgi:hypothetical protein
LFGQRRMSAESSPASRIRSSLQRLGGQTREVEPLLQTAIEWLRLPINLAADEPTQGHAIVVGAGQPWSDTYVTQRAGTPSLTTSGWASVASAIEDLVRSAGELELVLGVEYRPAGESVGAVDPNFLTVDWDALDRATIEHMAIQDRLAVLLTRYGLQPLSPTSMGPLYDLATMVAGRALVIEVKSASPENRVQQTRLGMGQVAEYRTVLKGRTKRAIDAAVVLGDAPAPVAARVGRDLDILVVSETQFEQSVLRQRYGLVPTEEGQG